VAELCTGAVHGVGVMHGVGPVHGLGAVHGLDALYTVDAVCSAGAVHTVGAVRGVSAAHSTQHRGQLSTRTAQGARGGCWPQGGAAKHQDCPGSTGWLLAPGRCRLGSPAEPWGAARGAWCWDMVRAHKPQGKQVQKMGSEEETHELPRQALPSSCISLTPVHPSPPRMASVKPTPSRPGSRPSTLCFGKPRWQRRRDLEEHQGGSCRGCARGCRQGGGQGVRKEKPNLAGATEHKASRGLSSPPILEQSRR